jgi:hypothetical protein
MYRDQGMAAKTFTVKGKDAIYGTIEIAWTDGVFDDPTGRVQALIDAEEVVCATATGPYFTAAPAPGHIALLTAVHALDEVTEIVGGHTFAAKLVKLAAIPASATA